MQEKILVVEDDRAVARGLEYGLRNEGYIVSLASTGTQALNTVRLESPDLILLDIRLPDLSGYDVCRHLRTAGQHQPILMLTARDEEMDKVLGLEMGADDYMVKPYGMRELLSRVRALLRRAYGDFAQNNRGKVYRFGEIEIDVEQMQARRSSQNLELTPTEFRLLNHFVAHPNQIFSRSQLIEIIWGYDSNVGDDRTIDVHMRHLRQKIESDPANPQWLITVRGAGYKLNAG